MSEPQPLGRDDDEDGPPRRRVKVRKGRCCGCFLFLLVMALVWTFGLFVHATRFVPFAIDAADRAPPLPEKHGPGLTVRWLGVTGYEISDGKTTILVDPVFTRPTVVDLWTGPLVTNDALAETACPKADFVLVNHAHYDHAADMPSIAKRTGAKVVGTASTLNLARSRGVAEDKLIEVKGGEHLTLGTFAVDVRRTRHPEVFHLDDFLPGSIAKDAGPLWWFQYRQDGCLAFRFASKGAVLWFHPTSTWEPGELSGLEAATLILGVAGEPLTPERAKAILGEIKPRRVLPCHWDNFLQPREKGLSRLPNVDLEAAEAAVKAASPGVAWWVLDYEQRVFVPPE